MLDGTPRPNRKEKHNAKVRARIMSAASEMFRTNGYDGTGIDALMSEAGLTRGAFYAHFMSKEALFIEVLSQDDPLLERLRARKGKTSTALLEEMETIFAGLLNPDTVGDSATMTNLIAFSHDVARGTDGARAAYEENYAAVLSEIARGQRFTPKDMQLNGVLNAVVSAISIARGCASLEQRKHALAHGKRMFGHFLRKFRRANETRGLAAATN